MAKVSTIREKIAHLLALAESPNENEANPWACSLAAVIAEHYCCQAYRSRKGGKRTVNVGLVGLEGDFEIAERIFLYAYDCVISAIKQKIKYNPKDERGTYREKCNAYGWGFVAGVETAFQEQEEEHKDWGLVLAVPQAVTDSMADMGKKTTFGTIKDNHIDFRLQGYEDGTKFDPTRRVAGEPERMAIGGAC